MAMLINCTLPTTEKPKYTVTFESNGGSAIEPREIEVGSTITEPTAPIKEDFSLAGWYKDAGLSSRWDFSSDIVTGDITLYAKWIYDFSAILYRELVAVPGGAYNQKSGTGSPDNFDHTVSSFSIGKYEVTYALWYKVRMWAEANGYTFENEGKEGSNGTEGAEPTEQKNEPVSRVSWRDAIVWCNAYSEVSGYTPSYTFGGNPIKNAEDAASCDGAVCAWNSNGYRLPSEGEWQYAASYKDGTTWTPYNFASGAWTYYNDISDTSPANGVYDNKDTNDAVAVYRYYWNNGSWAETGVTKTASAGSRQGNQLGIYDMSGNIAEWCWDWNASYPTSAQTDYRGPANGSYRAVRGGNFGFNSQYLTVGIRGSYLPDYVQLTIGFRIARSN